MKISCLTCFFSLMPSGSSNSINFVVKLFSLPKVFRVTKFAYTDNPKRSTHECTKAQFYRPLKEREKISYWLYSINEHVFTGEVIK